MADLVTSAGIGGTTTTLTSAAPSPNPSGDDRYMIGIACGYTADPSAFKYGGSGGTDLTQIGSDVLLNGVWGINVWGIAPGPTGATSAFANFGATASNALSAAFYSGVDQTGPHEGLQTASGDNGGFAATADAEITVTGTTSGQEVAVLLGFGVGGGPTLVSVTADEETTFVVRDDFEAPAGENQGGTAVIRGVAAGSTLTLTATITVSTTFGDLRWWAGALPLVDAAGSAAKPAYYYAQQ